MKKPKTRQRGEGSLQEANSFNEDKKNIRDEQLEEDEEQESEVSKEVGKKRSRRRWTQRPGVFMYIVNEDKGEGWVYASPNYEQSLNIQVVQNLKKLAGLKPQASTEILSDPKQSQPSKCSLNLDVYQRTRKDSNEDLVDNQDDISDLGRIRVQSNQPGIVYNLSTQIDIAKDDDRFREQQQDSDGIAIENFLKNVFHSFPAKPLTMDKLGVDLIQPRHKFKTTNTNSQYNISIIDQQVYGYHQNSYQTTNFTSISSFPQTTNTNNLPAHFENL
eukprot:TRINITY_DN3872_c0_g1_i1.p2 TRINITY_DN3872_c0_g1~~TRINITY_DN3872_c0_g1_i1.p2  ORF type:complete len:274 (+),score=14.70 TRINITY_DN3872_c0_g1_i1:134-955(+)